MVKKAMRPTQANPQGGISTVEAPIHVSNVMLVCPKCGKGTRVAHKVVVVEENGVKKRKIIACASRRAAATEID